MADRIKPRKAEDVEKAIAWAVGEDKRLEVVGSGSKQGVGRPLQTDLTLDLADLAGITLYEPEELVLAAHAGTPLALIEAALAERGQQLAFEPVDLGPVLGNAVGQATIGGMFAANISGPRRIKAGAARDHFLGVKAVSGRGETFKSGGRVVKNVTGYDLCKVLAGSWGTLAVMTEVTVKVLPAAETQLTLLAAGLEDAAAAQLMNAALGSSCDVSGAAHLPQGIAQRSTVAPVAAAGMPITALRLEGFAPSVSYRAEMLQRLMMPFGSVSRVDAASSKALWQEIGAAMVFAKEPGLPLWRISAPPMDGYKVMRRILGKCDARYFYDWGGGLIWLEVAQGDDPQVAAIREALGGSGHATLMRALPSIRASMPVFQPQPPALTALSRRLKDSFDPKGILNPGRMDTGG